MPSVPLPFTLPFFEKVDVFVVMDLRHRQLNRHFCPRVAALGTMSEAMRSFVDMARNVVRNMARKDLKVRLNVHLVEICR